MIDEATMARYMESANNLKNVTDFFQCVKNVTAEIAGLEVRCKVLLNCDAVFERID
jgi:hypothetical protein